MGIPISITSKTAGTAGGKKKQGVRRNPRGGGVPPQGKGPSSLFEVSSKSNSNKKS